LIAGGDGIKELLATMDEFGLSDFGIRGARIQQRTKDKRRQKCEGQFLH
jgi:hypothetical protein